MYSAMKLPGVSSIGSPPFSEIEYRCGQPSRYERKTMRPAAAQCRFVSPCVVGGEPRSVNGLFQSCCPSPVVASAVQMDHACARRSSTGSGAPPFPGRRVKAMRLPSGDHRGLESREVDGARYTMGDESFV